MAAKTHTIYFIVIIMLSRVKDQLSAPDRQTHRRRSRNRIPTPAATAAALHARKIPELIRQNGRTILFTTSTIIIMYRTSALGRSLFGRRNNK